MLAILLNLLYVPPYRESVILFNKPTYFTIFSKTVNYVNANKTTFIKVPQLNVFNHLSKVI